MSEIKNKKGESETVFFNEKSFEEENIDTCKAKMSKLELIMKQKTIKTDKATVLVVELPQGEKNVRVEKGYIRYDNESFNGCIPPVVLSEKGKGNWKLLGRLPDITEGQASGVVDNLDWHFNDGTSSLLFRDYRVKSEFDEPSRLPTAIKSLHSLLQANEVCFENSLGEEPNRNDDYYRDAMGVEYHYHDDLKKWQEAQSKVWDKERCYLFIKVD